MWVPIYWFMSDFTKIPVFFSKSGSAMATYGTHINESHATLTLSFSIKFVLEHEIKI